jgi:hypothetical protein
VTPTRASLRISSSPRTLRVAAEEDRGVLLLEIGEARIGPAASLEGEARRIEAGALQPLLETSVGLRVASEIDELLVGLIEGNLAFVEPDQRHDQLLAHQPGGVDFRLAPARRQPFRGDERENRLAAIGGFL